MALRDQVEADGTYTYFMGLFADQDGIVIGDYVYHSASTETSDDYNVVKPDAVDDSTVFGRWIRMYRSEIRYAHGVLHRPSSSLKTFMADVTVGSSGEVTLNLTEENTSGGTAFFPNAIRDINVIAIRNISTPIDVPWGSVKSIGSGNKTITFKCADAVALALLGNTAQDTASGVTLKVSITGE